MHALTKDKELKHLSWLIGVSLLALVSLLAVSTLWDVFAKWGVVAPPGSTETVMLSGEGRVFAAPDTARVTVSVVSEGASPAEVQKENTEKVNRVVAFFKEQGTADEDIKTVGYNLNPRYRFDEGEQTLVGYSLRQSVQVRTAKLDEVGTLVSGAVASGANEVSGVELFIDDPERVRGEAREEAVANIEAKRREMERELGVRFGRVVGLTESGEGVFPQPIPFGVESIAVPRGVGGAPDIQPGSEEVIVTVTVTYRLR